MLSELISWFKKRHKKMMILKVDFEKAFDSVNWSYLDFSLSQLGFGDRWRKWIQACLQSSRSSVLVNGSPTSEFSLKCGLRQGDPLSPYLFIIVMEGFHLTVESVVRNNALHGISVGNCKLSHFLFTDDAALVSEWHNNDLTVMFNLLDHFYLESGLKINMSKSNLFGVGVDQ
ncbi:secreted RxLR effector protein 78-like [Rutidosis leptorrhynchoides]|uniref:secreted RxLR effector protein 78-like n=1 Tax=Rutidosis leptorrhynchoides TaxID=125765 RepID=UPI003A99ADE7